MTPVNDHHEERAQTLKERPAMRITIDGRILELLQGDVTQQDVDAIVNAANSRLAGGGGVDGAIHRAGGPAIMDETRRYAEGCPTGSAVITGAGNLPAKYVIHAVGPVYRDGAHGEPELLAAAYRRCLDLAAENACRSIAFPSLSTGAYRFPIKTASRIALATAIEFLKTHDEPELVRFVLFSNDDLATFAQTLSDLPSA
jgi:O-acetyl-ADP-ribose deacetylase (regulator of RNase III)